MGRHAAIWGRPEVSSVWPPSHEPPAAPTADQLRQALEKFKRHILQSESARRVKPEGAAVPGRQHLNSRAVLIALGGSPRIRPAVPPDAPP
eukprot:2200092-Pyramimonas_sp.AAC.1